VVRDPDFDESVRNLDLPGTTYYSNNQIMVNQERAKRLIAPLSRLAELDAIARDHAQAMATHQELFHSDPVTLVLEKFNRPATRRMGRMSQWVQPFGIFIGA
jgi:hypothetical protein